MYPSAYGKLILFFSRAESSIISLLLGTGEERGSHYLKWENERYSFGGEKLDKVRMDIQLQFLMLKSVLLNE